MKILITTDNHLGYKEKDSVLENDSFTNFDEALSLAVNENVDFIFLAGDLFHIPNPSLSTFSQACRIL